jgi:hypothetical protein
MQHANVTTPPTLTQTELDDLLPGITQPAARLRHLQAHGFIRARIVDGRIILERSHYEAVCRGEFAAGRQGRYHAPELNLGSAHK